MFSRINSWWDALEAKKRRLLFLLVIALPYAINLGIYVSSMGQVPSCGKPPFTMVISTVWLLGILLMTVCRIVWIAVKENS